jgi:hypothetical protein
MLDQAISDFDRGLFRAVAEQLRKVQRRTESEDLLLAAALNELAEFDRAADLLDPLAHSENETIKAQAIALQADRSAARGLVTEAMESFRVGLRIATAADLPETACRIRLSQFGLSCALGLEIQDIVNHEQLKLDVLRSGRPDFISKYHVHAAAYHASSGDFSLAAAHI